MPDGFFFLLIADGDTVVNVTTVVLEPTTPRQCFNVSLVSDGLVEGAETVTLNVTLDTNVFSIRDVTPNTTDIVIIDQDGELSASYCIIASFVYFYTCRLCIWRQN